MSKSLYTVFCISLCFIFPLLSKAQPIANFSASQTTGCSPIIVQFNDLSTGSPTSWQWDLGNGATSTLQNPSTTYVTAGTYTITLTATNASGSNTKTITNYITVVPSPIVGFTANDTSSTCPPKTVQFTSTVNPGVAGAITYSWDFGDGFTSSQANPTHTYTAPGNYTVSLVVTNSSGCSKSLVRAQYVHVVAKPTANFTVTNNSGCSTPLTVSFTNTSTGAITSYLWNFGDGGTSTSTSPSHTYSTTGSYAVTLIAFTSGGCADTYVVNNLVIISSPHAAYSQSSNTICSGSSVSFTNSSTPATATYSWFFGDGGTSTATNPSHTYTTSGTFTVKLVVQQGSCKDSTSSTVTVNPKPVIQFSTSNSTACNPPLTVAFNNNTTGATSYLWRFGDGITSTTASPSHTYTTNGTFTVTLIATSPNGCVDSTVQTLIYIQPLTASISANPGFGCAPATISFSATVNSASPVVSYSWTFGDGGTGTGVSPTHTYSSAGTYTVTVSGTTTNGCTYSATNSVNIGTKPTAGFTASPTTVCVNVPVTFTNTSTGATGYTWYYGDNNVGNGSPSNHAYGSPGTYTVSIVAFNNGCSDTFTVSNMITVVGPIANFSIQYNCANRLSVNCTNATTGATAYSWDFGDGTSLSTATNPTHVYAAYGTYNITLTATTSANSCVATKVITVTLFPLAVNFSTNDTAICKGGTSVFTPSGGSSGNTPFSSWNFGDGGTSATGYVSVPHTYVQAGTYTIKLKLTDIWGCTDSFTRLNYVKVSGPTVAFNAAPPSGCSPLLVNFTDLSTVSAGGSITGRAWYFGDNTNNIGNNSSVAHTYTSNVATNYNVKLVVTDNLGCKDSITTSAVSIAKPHAAFSAISSVCKGVPVNFTNTSTGNNLLYSWNFGDGGTSNTASPTHIYNTNGSYTVRLIIAENGCSDTATNIINVNTAIPVFTMSDSIANCPPLTVNFTNNTVGATSYLWTFGNNNSSSVFSPSTVYTIPGVYTVKLKVSDNNGCQDSLSKTVTVNGPYGTFTYSPTIGCSPVIVQFNSVATNTQTYYWDMNNGVTQSSTTGSLSYTYTHPGTYIPILVLSNGSNCNVAIVGQDTIKIDSLAGDFNYTTAAACVNNVVQFHDTAYGVITSNVLRSWNFGDGGTSNSHNPTHTYTTAGTYTVRLIIGNISGCLDTIFHTVIIHALPSVSAGNSQTICTGNSTTLQVSGASSYIWTPATGLSCTGCTNPIATPSTTTVYTVTGTDANGCINTSNVTITVGNNPTITVAPIAPSICAGSNTNLLASGGATYLWTPATGLSCNNCSNPTASPPSTVTYTVTGTTAQGCTGNTTVTVTVNSIPNVTASPNVSICNGASTNLQAFGASSYSWTPATGLSCNNCSNPTANPTTTTAYIVTGTNANGCTDTGQVTVSVINLPNVSAGNNQNICIGSSVALLANGATSYNWTPGTGLSCTNCPNPTANPTTTTTYTVTGTIAGGCSNTSQVTVTVNPIPAVNAGANQTICAGATANLQATGAGTYVWSPATGLSCTSCANPNAGPSTTTTYTVTGTTAAGCSATSQVTVTVNAVPVLTVTPGQSICKGASLQLEVLGATTYQWSPSAGLSCINCSNPIATPASPITYTVTGTGSNGCTSTAQVQVLFYAQPIINAGPDKTICRGESVTLQATGGTNYTWTPPTGLSCTNCATPAASPVNNITYKVVGVDISGCRDSDEIAITVIQKIPTSVGNSLSICKGESAQLHASGGTSYIWSPAATLTNSEIADPIAFPETTTRYYVVIKQNQCFNDTLSQQVNVYPMPMVDLGPDQSVFAGASINLFANSSNANIFMWSPPEGLSCTNCNSPVATPPYDITYTVIASNQYGCKASDDIHIRLKCETTQIFVPNTFTPNGDGENDRFFPHGNGINTVQRFRVYDRWGELIFDMKNMPVNDAQYGWDGTYKNQPLKPDTYVYILQATCINGDPIELKGDISLVR